MTGVLWLAAARHIPKIPADWPGWLVIGIILLLAVRAVFNALGGK